MTVARTLRSVALAAMTVGGAATPAWPQPAEQADAGTELRKGESEFHEYCAVCHGLDGRGTGPLAEAMTIVPSDLTRLSARHNGEFPAAKVADVIRNGGNVLGHGRSAMLAWGTYFSERHNPAVARARIKALVRYIEQLQAK